MENSFSFKYIKLGVSYVYEELPYFFSILGPVHKMIGIEGKENNVSQVKTNLSFEYKGFDQWTTVFQFHQLH